MYWFAKATPISAVDCSMVEETRVVVGQVARRNDRHMLLSISCTAISIYVES